VRLQATLCRAACFLVISSELGTAGMFALRRRKRTNHLTLSFFPAKISHDFSPHEATVGVQDTGYVARRGQVAVRHIDELHRLRILRRH
jgi:hypothetical protein